MSSEWVALALLGLAVVAAFGSGFYFGAWRMKDVAEKAIDAAFDEFEDPA